MVGKSCMQAFEGIKGRIWNCLNNWKTKFLTQAGKEILIKAIAQAIPTYCMSVFLLPKALCREIQGMMQRFWWGHKENTSRIHWMSWERMGQSKAKGGLGFVIWKSLTKPCSQNKFGGFCRIQILWRRKF
jgi:hypothetical protein